jgi:hypothetical protein
MSFISGMAQTTQTPAYILQPPPLQVQNCLNFLKSSDLHIAAPNLILPSHAHILLAVQRTPTQLSKAIVLAAQESLFPLHDCSILVCNNMPSYGWCFSARNFNVGEHLTSYGRNKLTTEMCCNLRAPTGSDGLRRASGALPSFAACYHG